MQYLLVGSVSSFAMNNPVFGYFVKIILFVGLTNPPETKTYKVYEAVPTTNKESVGKGKPRKPLGLPFNLFCLHSTVRP